MAVTAITDLMRLRFTTHLLWSAIPGGLLYLQTLPQVSGTVCELVTYDTKGAR